MKFGVTVRSTEATGGDYSGGFLCRTDSKPIGHSATVAWHAERLESLTSQFADGSAYQIADAYAWRGEVDLAFGKWGQVHFSDAEKMNLTPFSVCERRRNVGHNTKWSTLTTRIWSSRHKIPASPREQVPAATPEFTPAIPACPLSMAVKKLHCSGFESV
jgi:hypothetical protein